MQVALYFMNVNLDKVLYFSDPVFLPAKVFKNFNHNTCFIGLVCPLCKIAYLEP